MKHEKFHIEYTMENVSRHSLWNHLTTPPGLASWFADRVTIKGNCYTFYWNKESQQAVVLEMKPEEKIRFRWTDEECQEIYFEFIIHTIELTGTTALEITDFSEPEEKSDSIDLWDTQVEALKRSLGI